MTSVQCGNQCPGGPTEDYRAIADDLAAEIAAGRLRPGDRLPPQRTFARSRGIAVSTAGRVYRELTSRGLVVGEVGRGTFVRAAAPACGPALAEPAAARIDLELNHPHVPEQTALLAEGLGRLLRPDALEQALRPVGASGTAAARSAVAAMLTRDDWAPDPAHILFAGSGRSAIAAAIAAQVPPGGRLGVEALTYPVVKAIAARLGVVPVPVETDEGGMRPDALAATHRSTPLRAVYLQPTLHNPFGTTMGPQRRAEFAAVLRQADLYAIEDSVWAFLHRDAPPPLAALAPERTILIDSLTKRLAPGLTVGFAVAPEARIAPLAAALRSGAWPAARFALDAATRWLTDGTAETLVLAKREEVAARRKIADRSLAGFTVRADPQACSIWWELPEPWRAETFVAAAARRSIAVTPGAAFVVGAGQAPNAVRLGLASPSREILAGALDTLAAIAAGSPEDSVPD
ncbi:PLP-dependent aminotransferase family protein [Peterkaempfera sp. SMS 1(5)a]|uniref:aminotransferase-like domain-containing protein n=1 Tax=Peterkaempfera podocarpi TaxID=3232308 RepID=UPI0036731E47